MAALGRVIVEAIVHQYGRDELLALAHRFWFNPWPVMGMDWHSSGITISVIAALKRGLAPVQAELGIYVCGGKGAHSRRTPDELAQIGDRTGIDATPLIRASRLVAKIDAAAVQDGFDLYLHGFFASVEGRWCVVYGHERGFAGSAPLPLAIRESSRFFRIPTQRSGRPQSRIDREPGSRARRP